MSSARTGRSIRGIANQLSLLWRTWQLVWHSGSKWAAAWLVLLSFVGLLPLATIGATKELVDHLMAAIRHSGSAVETRSALVWAGVLIVSFVLTDLLQSLLEWIGTVQSELLTDHIGKLIHAKSAEVDLAFFESPEYYDRLYRARDEAQTRPANLIESAGALLQHGVTLLLMMAIAASYGPWLLVAILGAMLPAIFVVVRYNWLTHEWWTSTTTERRWIQYYDEKLTSPSAAPEIRLFGLLERFDQPWRRLRKILRRQHLRLIEKQSVARLISSLAGLSVAGSAIAWMGWKALHGAATLGDLVLFYQVFAGGQSLMRGLTGNAGKVYGHTLFVANLFHFLDLKPTLEEPPDPLPAPAEIVSGVRFRGVRFQYPGSDREAIDDLDLYLPANKITAIVGPNGAGKSTLIKLLARYYDPVSGSIEIDGIDLRDMRIADLRAAISILFQVPVRYDASARENIEIGESAIPSDFLRTRSAAMAAGIDPAIAGLPSGYDTLLGKSFENGCELSTGEWQRVALARALLRESPLVLMDEPTSAMDSWAEADWYERIRTATRGRTVLIITHRFTIARRADFIYVMQKGRIAESGSHEMLLDRGGIYAGCWHEQVHASRARESEPEVLADGAEL